MTKKMVDGVVVNLTPEEEGEYLNNILSVRVIVPAVVSRAQGKAALIQQGHWAVVVTFVASIADPTQKALAEVALNDTQEWRRDSAFIEQLRGVLGLSEEQVDDLFKLAASITF